MSIEELEEYIQKNRAKNYNPYSNGESRSLNTSFSSNNHFGIQEKKEKLNQGTMSVKKNKKQKKKI